METVSPVPLELRLAEVAAIWCDRNEATLARLGRAVVNDGGFFARLESPGASTTTATLAKFARFLVDSKNWPEGAVAEEARALAHVVGVSLLPTASLLEADSPAEAAVSAGNAGELSGSFDGAQDERTGRAVA